MTLLLAGAWLSALAGGGGQQIQQPCTGCVPLTDLGAGLYQGAYPGGLYAGGANVPPAALATAAASEAAQIVPRDPAGQPDPDGFVGFVSFTMSNATLEFSPFERRADSDPNRNASVRIVNMAQNGAALDTLVNPNALYWSNVQQRVQAAGLTPEQVQVAWLKMADGGPRSTVFPDHALVTKANAVGVLQILRGTFPNLRITYFSSRIFGGYTTHPLRGEPVSYETGFAVKWLIEDQQAGDPALNWDPQAGPVLSPLVLWGPYLWANGPTPRSDGLVWLPADYQADFIRPSPAGAQKVVDMLEPFFRYEATTQGWYSSPAGVRLETLDAVADAAIDPTQPLVNFGAAPDLIVDGGRDAYLKFDLSSVAGTIEAAKLNLVISPATTFKGLEAWSVTDTSWDESTLTAANAPPIDGPFLGTMPIQSVGATASFDVTAVVRAAAGGSVSFALIEGPGTPGNKSVASREGVEPPRLVLTVRPTVASPGVPFCPPLASSIGQPGRLSLSGSASLAANDLTLVVDDLPPQKSLLFVYGFASAQLPFGDGLLCAAAPLARLPPPLLSDSLGSASRPLDSGQPPLGSGPAAVGAGDTVYFQTWYRDPTGGPAGFNLSDAVQLTFAP